MGRLLFPQHCLQQQKMDAYTRPLQDFTVASGGKICKTFGIILSPHGGEGVVGFSPLACAMQSRLPAALNQHFQAGACSCVGHAHTDS